MGVWAAVLPVSFYNDFRLPGRRWVSALGPYSEHLIRDVGGLYLALLVLSIYALVIAGCGFGQSYLFARPQGETRRPTGWPLSA
uniref:Uncharacterized protein n=1 Tax=uncultured bacterium esnapd8 TaxID=1366615 RepID=S5UC96_9BACT|nr:hypothetical protein [uncultured bacterium esnapd8]